MPERVEIYDTTLRDGAQTPGIDLTVGNKVRISQRLADLGVPFVEGGWPGATPTDTEFFMSAARDVDWRNTQLVAFGMTSRIGLRPEDDPQLKALLDANTSIITLFGKTSPFNVEVEFGATLEDNLETIHDSIKFLVQEGRRVFFDAEHFFDGYKEKPEYALSSIQEAKRAGAEVVVLCDTRGWATPAFIRKATHAAKRAVGFTELGIHVHNDRGLANINTIEAIRAGATQVQVTVNGAGERTGNVDLCQVVPTAELSYEIRTGIPLEQLVSLSRFVELENGLRVPVNTPYVGENAFTHKGGAHVSAVRKRSKTYEHIDPAVVGATRSFEHSDQGGGANVLEIAAKWGYDLDRRDPRVPMMVEQMKNLKSLGDAQEFLMLYRVLEEGREIFKLDAGTSVQSGRDNLHLANVVVSFDGGEPKEAPVAYSEQGAFDAFNRGLRLLLERRFPVVNDIKLLDYRVSIPQRDLKAGTGAEVEVYTEFGSNGDRWTSIRRHVDEQTANQDALVDGYLYYIMKRRKERIK